jgi:glucokinase
MNKRVVAGIDIGGTKIAIALESHTGDRVAADRLPTQVELGPESNLENISKTLEKMLSETNSDLAAIGVVSPGPIDIERGLILSPTNLPGWDGFPIVEKLEKRFNVPVSFDNDANAAGLGEYFYGAGRGFKDVFYVTISTGIGGAIICNGQIHHGVDASAGEVGHTVVKEGGARCRCGVEGCLETIASGLSIARRMKEKLAEENGNMGENSSEITAETVVEAVKKGDRTACDIWAETVHYLGIGIGNAITLIAPEAVIIGGGVASAGELLLEPLRREIAKNVSMMPIEKVKILQASLGSESGVCGALMLAQKATKETNVYEKQFNQA